MLWGSMNTSTMAMNAMTSDLGTISQNIANVNTTGYKAVQTEFKTAMSEHITQSNDGSGASPGGVSAFGVAAYSHNLITAQGSFQTASQFSDLAINGQGFFMVAQPGANGAVPSTSTASLFTRNGAFQEKAGATGQQYLTDASGNYLLGWQGSGGKVSAGGGVSPIFIPAATTVTRNNVSTQVDMPANATTAVTLGANITPDNRNNATPDVESISLNAFDSLSNSHAFLLQFKPVVNNTSSNTTTTTDTSTSPATTTTTGPTSTVTQTSLNPDVWNLTFATSESGATITSAGSSTPTTSTSSTTAGTVTTQVTSVTSTDQGTTVTFNANGTVATPKTLTFNATWSDGQTSSITIDISNMTQYGGTSKSVTNFVTQDGYPDGQLQSLAFDQNGVLSGSYSNGKAMQLAQVGLARFPAADSLEPVSSTLFKQTKESGQPLIGAANALGASVEGNTLETSTVDIGTEFTNMILAQKAYGMNSEVLKTADQMTQTARDLQT